MILYQIHIFLAISLLLYVAILKLLRLRVISAKYIIALALVKLCTNTTALCLYAFLPKSWHVLMWMFHIFLALDFGYYLYLTYRYEYRHVDEPFDVIFVFGAGLVWDKISRSLKTRLDQAIEVHLKNPQAVMIVSGGQGKDEALPEAKAMYDYLVNQGMDASKIIQEDQSTSTYENLVYASRLYPLTQAHVAFVSNHYHIYRIERMAKKLGIQGKGICASYHYYSVLVFYIREYFAIWKARLKGQL